MTASEPVDSYLRQAWDTDAVVNVVLPDGQHVYVVPESRLESLVETMNARSDPSTVEAIHAGLRDIEAGDVVSVDEARRILAERSE